MATAITSFDFDYCYVEVAAETGYATVRDRWDNLAIGYFDSLEEALEFLQEGEKDS